MLQRKGYGEKYDCAGIYCIQINGIIVYIGKSVNMLYRISEHYVGIKMGTEKKYRILSEAWRKGHIISFDVLYIAKSKDYNSQVIEIGEKEGEYIRKYNPILNTQIPKASDWKKFDIKEVDARKILKMFEREE